MNNRKILYALGFCAAIVSFAQNLYVPLMPEIQKDLHTSLYMVNLSVTLFTVALAVLQIVYGPLIDRNGRKKILLPGMIIYVLATLGCSLSFSIEMLLIFRLFQGIGAAAVPLVAATMIGDLFEGKERAEAMATYQMILGIAPAVGPLIGGAIGSVAGYSGAFGFLAVTAFIMLLVVILVLPETQPVNVQSNRLDLGSFARIFKNRTGSAVLFTGFVLYDVFYTLIVFLPVILEARYHLSVAQIGLASMLLMAFSLVGSKLSGKLQARIGSSKSLILTFSFVIVSLILFIIAVQMSLLVLLITLGIIGFFCGLTMSALPTLLAVEFVKERATAIGVYNFVRYLGMATAPMLGSLLYFYGGLTLLIGFTAFLVGVAVVFSSLQLGLLTKKTDGAKGIH
ncbi:MFS transporter [Paenibacillus radicis (ex Xue et al. 2023)]|uniref:MFS transporter n=1 Tax=Paenibacillus radicis (ex Xue et al. 2023) TaxID=2972489 RepID=A0ABT1YAR1_9BACL|nr:MFS transporter [Paenibacillus radicis (ex Xue et al. 2023)]MCR8630273.1 MFS transporter [Paenibacillus radicis (ex Xue et al. 2023)]